MLKCLKDKQQGGERERKRERERERVREKREERGLSRDTKTCPNFPRDHYTLS